MPRFEEDTLFSRHFPDDPKCPECVLNGFPMLHNGCPEKGLLHADFERDSPNLVMCSGCDETREWD
jgi:hypothetical protein